MHALKLPAKAPCPGGLFTFARAAAIQCESNVTYPVKKDSPEDEYFTHWVKIALEHTGELMKGAPQLRDPILPAFVACEDFELIEIKYNQLKHMPKFTPGMKQSYTEDEDYRPDGYETYVDFFDTKIHYAINPSGYHYLVQKWPSWDWSWQLVVKGDLGEFNLTQEGQVAERTMTYAIQLSVAKLPKEGASYLGTEVKPGSKVIQIAFGELLSSCFVTWTKMYVADKTIVSALIKCDVWKPLTPPDDDEEEEEAAIEAGELTCGNKYSFNTIDDKLCVWFPGKSSKDDGEYKVLANFTIEGVMAIYQFADREKGMPWFRYKVRAIIDKDKEDVLYVTPEMDVGLQKYTTVGRIEGEVLVPLDEVEDKTLSGYFSKISAYLRCEGHFKV